MTRPGNAWARRDSGKITADHDRFNFAEPVHINFEEANAGGAAATSHGPSLAQVSSLAYSSSVASASSSIDALTNDDEDDLLRIASMIESSPPPPAGEISFEGSSSSEKPGEEKPTTTIPGAGDKNINNNNENNGDEGIRVSKVVEECMEAFRSKVLPWTRNFLSRAMSCFNVADTPQETTANNNGVDPLLNMDIIEDKDAMSLMGKEVLTMQSTFVSKDLTFEDEAWRYAGE